MKHRILLVEDDVCVGSVVHEFLGEAGYEVTLAGSLAATKKMTDYKFSAVVSDFQLLDGDACDVIAFLRCKKPSIPAVIVSGSGNFAANHCAERGIKGVFFLRKPFKIQRLLDYLNALILADTMWPVLTEI